MAHGPGLGCTVLLAIGALGPTKSSDGLFHTTLLITFSHFLSFKANTQRNKTSLEILNYCAVVSAMHLKVFIHSLTNRLIIIIIIIIIISQYLYRNVQFSRASLNGVLFFYESILRREETGVPGGNPRSQVEFD